MITENLQKVTEEVSNEDRFLSGLASLLFNVDPVGGKFEKGKIQDAVKQIDALVNTQVNEVIHSEKFQLLESTWRGLDDIIQHTNFRANVMIDMLDVGKAELADDFENNSVDITGGALFKKAYVAEYDQYGGKPFGAIIGSLRFRAHSQGDLLAAAHGQGRRGRARAFRELDIAEVLRLQHDRRALCDQGPPRDARSAEIRRVELVP